MVAQDFSARSLVQIVGLENLSMAAAQAPSTRKVVIEVKEVDDSVRSATKSAQMWYTISNQSAAGKVTSGKSDGVFRTRHELIMDSDDQIVFKVKHCRSMLQRNATVGVFSTCLRNLDEMVPLLNVDGQTVGMVHLAIAVCDEVPTCHLNACPWTKDGHTIKRDFECNGQTVNVRHRSSHNLFAVTHNSTRIAARYIENTWSILEASNSKCMKLEGSTDCSEFELSNSDYKLVKGNLFERCTLEGTWTLAKGKDLVALINVAGPFVSCCNQSDMAMAVAIGTAMYLSTTRNQRVWDSIVDRMVQLRSLKSKFSSSDASMVSGDGFFVFGGVSFFETSLKNAGIGGNNWVVEHNYLRRNILSQHSSSSDAVAPTVASELGWSDFTGFF